MKKIFWPLHAHHKDYLIACKFYIYPWSLIVWIDKLTIRIKNNPITIIDVKNTFQILFTVDGMSTLDCFLLLHVSSQDKWFNYRVWVIFVCWIARSVPQYNRVLGHFGQTWRSLKCNVNYVNWVYMYEIGKRCDTVLTWFYCRKS